MSRMDDFTRPTKKAAIERQQGKCAFCGVPINTQWSEGDYPGHAHHLKPLIHGGRSNLENCVYLCEAHHKFLGHGMAPLDIDKQGGSSDTWVQLERDDFPYWNLELD
jgi:predicted restriction endonuclease